MMLIFWKRSALKAIHRLGSFLDLALMNKNPIPLGEMSKFPPSNHKMLQDHLRGSVAQSVIFAEVSQN